MTTATVDPVAEWSKPSSRPEHIDELISGVDRYNPQNLAVLTEYLDQQLQTGEYDCLANLAILKLYQFNPQDFDYNIAISILLKALTAAPLSDFNLCLSLLGEAPVAVLPSATPQIPEGASDEEKAELTRAAEEAANVPAAGNLTDPMIVRLATLSAHLLSAHFRLFWKTLDSDEFNEVREFTRTAHGFDDAVRRVALDSVKGAFRTIDAKRLASYLDLEKDELPAFIQKQSGWTMEGDAVHVPANADNDVKASVIREDIQLDQLSKFLQQSQAPILRA